MHRFDHGSNDYDWKLRIARRGCDVTRCPLDHGPRCTADRVVAFHTVPVVDSCRTYTMGNEQTKPDAPAEPVEPKKAPVLGKSGKKICCSCPETKKPRDLCIVTKGEDNCRDLIEAHNKCLRAEGFIIKDK